MLSIFCFMLDLSISIYVWIIIISIFLTWVPTDPYSPAVQFINRATRPTLETARRLFPFLLISGIDFSPIVVILALQYLPRLVCGILA